MTDAGITPSVPVAATPRGLRVYSSPAGARRYRRATDILLLLSALVGLAALLLAYPPGRFEERLVGLLHGVPDWIAPAGSFLYDLLAVAAVATIGTAVVARRGFVLLQAVASLAVAVGVALVAGRLSLGHWPNLRTGIEGGSSAPDFPGVRVAVAAVVILAISPHLVKPLQLAARWVLAAGFFGALIVDSAVPSGNVAGLLIGVIAAAGVRLAFGTSAGLPRLSDVAASLAELRVSTGPLELADRQIAGVVVVRGREPDGHELVIKVHGRDAYDNQLLEKLWRTLWYRDGGAGFRLSRAEAVEHEAFVTLLAQAHGVATLDVLRGGTTTGGDALLVLRGSARPFASLAGEEFDTELVGRAWAALAVLHGANIAHGRVDTSSVALVGDDVGFVDLGGATATPTADQLLTDCAQLLVTTATLIGPGPALKVARSALGADGVGALLPYLQLAALEDPLRRATKAASLDVDGLRRDAAALVGQDEPALVRLRRVTWKSLLQIALLILAGFAVLSFATGIDYEQVRLGLSNAAWGWIVLGALVAQTPRVTQAVTTLGAVAADLRFGPVYAMQLATGYLNLALPSVAARLALSIRFFQRQGITPAAALTGGAIDSLASTVVQAILLTLLLIFSGSTLSLDLDTPSGRTFVVIGVLIGLLGVAIGAAFLVRRIRRAVLGRVRKWWPEIRTALGSLRSSNKLALLLFGSLATEVLFASALGLFALGLGTRVALTDLLVINISVSLLSTFVPVPGGIGVTELGLTVGLTTAGMAEESALVAVLLYRISCFYVPPVWGFFALRWLERRRYL
jgi:uncharacterized membrane protein YbhN (UPF0104 family)